MSNIPGENFEIKPDFDNPLLNLTDPNNEVATLWQSTMERLTNPGYEALTSDGSTIEVATVLLDSCRWATTFRYLTRAEELLAAFERLGIEETDATADILSEYRFARFWLLKTRLDGDKTTGRLLLDPILAEEEERIGVTQNLYNMITELAGQGHVDHFSRWLHLTYGDLSKHTPDDGHRFDPSPSKDEPPETKLGMLWLDVSKNATGLTSSYPDPHLYDEYLDIFDRFCKRDPGGRLVRDLWGTTYRHFDSFGLPDGSVGERAKIGYREALVAFLQRHIPSLEGGILANRYERNALSELIEIGWHEPGYRKEVDRILEDLRSQGSFSEGDEAKIAAWKQDFVRRIKYKGSYRFSWQDQRPAPPRH
jgi:hypothetical protein